MGLADFSHPDVGASASYRRETAFCLVKVSVSYVLRAVGDQWGQRLIPGSLQEAGVAPKTGRWPVAADGGG